MQTFGLGWYVVQLAVSDGAPQLAPLYLGLVAATRAIPSLLIGLLAGTISDRMDRRELLMLSSGSSAVVAAAFAAAVIAGQANLPVLLVLNTLGAATFAFEPVTRSAMIPRIVPRPAIASAVGLIMTTTTTASLLGPLAGGLLIGPLGVGGLMALNAASFLPVTGAMVAMRAMPVEAAQRTPLLRSLGGGVVYVWRHPFLRSIFVLSAVVGLAARPSQQLLPAFAHEVLHVGAVELSWLFAAAGAGSIGGSLVIATIGSSASRGRLLAASAIATGALTVIFSMQQALPLALVAMAALSVASTAQIGVHIAAYQSTAPEDVRGRVTAVSSSLVQSSTALGALGLGLIGSITGVDLALGFGGALCVAAGFVAWRSPALRAWEHDARPVATGEPAH